MIHRLKNLIAPALLAAGLAACGGGGSLSVHDAFHDSVAASCSKAYECMDTFPGDPATFELIYGTSEQDCVDSLTEAVEAQIEAYEESIDAGRIEYDSGDAQECLDSQSGAACDEYWTGEAPAACDTAFTGTVADGDPCTINDDCAGPDSSCDEVELVCG